ncbi:hypothetical protein EDC04DRAFT_2629186 [Pisolithus marmoratus]|nr:hypothetical protein EDC04DRAFT_2629186 [Pisolithus marmoratus]
MPHFAASSASSLIYSRAISYGHLSCRNKTSRHTCLTCNIPYCSLACFRSEARAQCSELFYRKEIVHGISLNSSKAMQEYSGFSNASMMRVCTTMANFRVSPTTRTMMKAWKMASWIRGSADELLGRLTKEERNTFCTLLRDPASEFTSGTFCMHGSRRGTPCIMLLLLAGSCRRPEHCCHSIWSPVTLHRGTSRAHTPESGVPSTAV